MDSIPPTRIQQKINNVLNCAVTHAVVVLVVLFDVLILTILIVIDLCIKEGLTHNCTNCTAECARFDGIRQTQLAISIFQLAILSGFIVEIIIRILSNVPIIRHDKWQVFDCLVVMVSFTLFTILLVKVSKRIAAYSVACIISLRLWRIGRLCYVVKHEAIKSADVQLRKSSDYEKRLKKAEHKINLQKRQMERLEQAMLFFKSLAYSTHSASNHSQLLPDVTDTEEDKVIDVNYVLNNSESPRILNDSLGSQTETSSHSVTNHCLCNCDILLNHGDHMYEAKYQDNSVAAATTAAADRDYQAFHDSCLIGCSCNIAAVQNTKPSSQSDAILSKENADDDLKLKELQSYIRSLQSADADSYINEAYTGDYTADCYLQSNCPGFNQMAKISSNNSSIGRLSEEAFVMCTAQSQAIVDETVCRNENIGNDTSYPFDTQQSYLSEDGIPMTDL